LSGLFTKTDLARAFAAVLNRPAPFEDVERGLVLVYRAPKMLQHAAERMAQLWPSPAQCSREVRAELKLPSCDTRMAGSKMSDDLGRSCECQLNPPQKGRLISMSSSAMSISFPSRLVKSSPRRKAARERQIRFLVGRTGAEKGEGKHCPGKNQGDMPDDG
jgi:hypothetical protein